MKVYIFRPKTKNFYSGNNSALTVNLTFSKWNGDRPIHCEPKLKQSTITSTQTEHHLVINQLTAQSSTKGHNSIIS